MDPIYYQVNQTKLTEVTQKTSDNLRLQSNKEARRKAQTSEVDKSALSSDTSSMSDDMLGNMDPDDYGGRGAQQFAQMWKEQLDRDEAEEEDEDDDEEGEGEPEDENAPNKEEAEIEGIAAEVPDNPVTAPATQSAVATEPEQVQEPADERERPQAARESRPAAAEPAAAEPPTAREKPSAPSQEKFAAQDKVTPPTGPPPPQKKSSRGSLLDFSSGYLIAEEAAWEGATEEAATEESAVEEEVLPEEISILLERLVSGDSAHPSFRRLNQLLSRFGRRVLQQCLEAHAKVYLLPPGESLLAHPQLASCGFPDLEGAAYLPEQRVCLVEDVCLAQAPHGFHPVFYYFAHLWDHAMGGENFASLKSAAVRASFQACLEGAHRFGDLMAAHTPAHYFAQAVESYLAENDCFEPLWTRQDLYDFDRSIYDYIEYLLK